MSNTCFVEGVFYGALDKIQTLATDIASNTDENCVFAQIRSCGGIFPSYKDDLYQLRFDMVFPEGLYNTEFTPLDDLETLVNSPVYDVNVSWMATGDDWDQYDVFDASGKFFPFKYIVDGEDIEDVWPEMAPFQSYEALMQFLMSQGISCDDYTGMEAEWFYREDFHGMEVAALKVVPVHHLELDGTDQQNVFEFTITETLKKTVRIKARNLKEARETIEDLYWYHNVTGEGITLNGDDFSDSDIDFNRVVDTELAYDYDAEEVNIHE